MYAHPALLLVTSTPLQHTTIACIYYNKICNSCITALHNSIVTLECLSFPRPNKSLCWNKMIKIVPYTFTCHFQVTDTGHRWKFFHEKKFVDRLWCNIYCTSMYNGYSCPLLDSNTNAETPERGPKAFTEATRCISWWTMNAQFSTPYNSSIYSIYDKFAKGYIYCICGSIFLLML